MTRGLTDENGQFAPTAADEIREFGQAADVIALGPGLGRREILTAFAQRLYREVRQPMVVDADALFALAEAPGMLERPGGPRVLTPHPGEFARLAGNGISDSLIRSGEGSDRVTTATALARRDPNGTTVVVLKGHQTVVTDGAKFSINHTGNPGMATGGSGDVLTGIITALLCQGLTPFDAARLGTHVHGLAGDLAAAELGQVSLIASDLINFLPRAFCGF
jgi:NAD(P)H-hydrate epimerase